MIEAVIFDLDGLLIDSEHIWRKSQIQVYETVGVTLTVEDLKQTMGKKIDETVTYWSHKRPWKNTSKEKIKSLIEYKVIELIESEGKTKPGVIETLEFFKNKSMTMAVASSSSSDIVKTAVNSLGIGDYFVELFSAEHETHGKPHPAVFLRTAEQLGFNPSSCLVFEDSPSGVLSAKAANMKCIAVPEKESLDDPAINTADKVLGSLEDFNQSVFDLLNN